MARKQRPDPKPAFPQANTIEGVIYKQGAHQGLTDREFFAGCALIGIRASGITADSAFAAKAAWADADAMLEGGAV